ncbi:MAG TPA: discoidin domain-containing protein [Candidatus Polarisedimenticolaceae bacterium]|nr:discoidin domain-containing protein [Candidatus Polarisedimenticolaceae bacterium]
MTAAPDRRCALRFGPTLLALLALAAAGRPTDGAVACPEGNLLERARVSSSYDAYHVERLTDGIVAPEGEHWLSDRNSLFTTLGRVTFELPRTTRVNAVYLQGDSNDSYRISVSEDGTRWQPLGEVPAVPGPGVRRRYAAEFDHELRYLRVEPGTGDGDFAIAEIAAYCGVPEPWPPSFATRTGTVRDAAWAASRQRRLALWKIAYGVAGGLVLLGVAARRRLPPRLETALLVAVGLAGALAWTNFGTFHGPNVLHHHDVFHYVMGSKYFAENGYSGLYHCTEVAEAELGRREFVERRVIRNLTTNELEPASIVLDDTQRCRSAFSAARWDEFKRDVEFFRAGVYPGSWGTIFRDHGYNATPVWTMAGGRIANLDALSRRPVWLAAIDFALYAGLFAMIAWAFGLEVAALGALIWGVGLPWQYYWTGGAFARVPWLALSVAAICLARRLRFGAAGFALTSAALLRVFPALLVLGPMMVGARDALRAGRPARPTIRAAAGALVALVLLLPLSAWAGGGFGVWTEFRDNLRKHSASPLGNDVGLPAIFAWSASNTQAEVLDGRLDRFARWEQARRETFAARRPAYLAAALAVLGLFAVFVLRYARSEWEQLAAGTLPMLALAELASYYLIVLLLLAPFAARRPARVVIFVLTVVASQLVSLTDPSVDTLFFIQSLLFVGCAIAIVADVIRVRRRPTARQA